MNPEIDECIMKEFGGGKELSIKQVIRDDLSVLPRYLRRANREIGALIRHLDFDVTEHDHFSKKVDADLITLKSVSLKNSESDATESLH
jgi:hypothetical protein